MSTQLTLPQARHISQWNPAVFYASLCVWSILFVHLSLEMLSKNCLCWVRPASDDLYVLVHRHPTHPPPTKPCTSVNGILLCFKHHYVFKWFSYISLLLHLKLWNMGVATCADLDLLLIIYTFWFRTRGQFNNSFIHFWVNLKLSWK